MSEFRFKQFSVKSECSAMKVGTDAVLLGSAMTILPTDVALLDIGTGTGVIALMAAQRQINAKITAIDIDEPSASEAAYNFSRSPFAQRLNCICTPLSSFIPAQKFDLIFSNPPYYDSSLLNPDVRVARARHTETMSYRHICGFASEYLMPEGRLSLILPADTERDLKRTAASFGLCLYKLIRIRTTANKPFSRIIAEFCLKSNVGGLGEWSGESRSVFGGGFSGGCFGGGEELGMGQDEVSAMNMGLKGEGARADGKMPYDSELTLHSSNGSKTPEYAALTANFYL